MPYSPKRPCRYPGCTKLTTGQYCPEHQKMVCHNYNRYQRDPHSNRRYGRSWKRIRDRYIQAHPLCEDCLSRGVLEPATEVHHKLPLSRGGTNDVGNLMALCKPCHSHITVEMGDRWGR